MNLEPKKQNQEVVFRRIRGRIIPIRKNMTKKQNSELVKGAGYVAAGAAVSIGAGEGAAQLVKAAAAKRVKAKFEFNRIFRGFKRSGKAEQVTFEFLRGANRFKGSAREAAQGAIKTRRSAFRLFKARNIVLGLGSLAGAALFSLGLNKIAKSVGNKELEDKEEAVNNIVGAVAAAAATSFYYRRLGLRNASLLKAFTSAKTKGAARPYPLPIKFSKGGPFGKGGTFRFRG